MPQSSTTDIHEMTILTVVMTTPEWFQHPCQSFLPASECFCWARLVKPVFLKTIHLKRQHVIAQKCWLGEIREGTVNCREGRGDRGPAWPHSCLCPGNRADSWTLHVIIVQTEDTRLKRTGTNSRLWDDSSIWLCQHHNQLMGISHTPCSLVQPQMCFLLCVCFYGWLPHHVSCRAACSSLSKKQKPQHYLTPCWQQNIRSCVMTLRTSNGSQNTAVRKRFSLWMKHQCACQANKSISCLT